MNQEELELQEDMRASIKLQMLRDVIVPHSLSQCNSYLLHKGSCYSDEFLKGQKKTMEQILYILENTYFNTVHTTISINGRGYITSEAISDGKTLYTERIHPKRLGLKKTKKHPKDYSDDIKRELAQAAEEAARVCDTYKMSSFGDRLLDIVKVIVGETEE